MRKAAAMEFKTSTREDERKLSRELSCQQQQQRRPSSRQRRGGPVITTPNEQDILCGKEKHCIIHPGTRRYRQFIDAFQPRYRNATNKHDKMEITKEIVLTLGRTARFLRYNKDTKTYEELSHLEARDKTSHALRTACKRISKQQKRSCVKPASVPSTTSATTRTTTAPPPPLLVPEVAVSSSSASASNMTPLSWQSPPPLQQHSNNYHSHERPRFPGRMSVDHHHPLPIHSEERMDGSLFDDLLTLLKDPEPHQNE